MKTVVGGGRVISIPDGRDKVGTEAVFNVHGRTFYCKRIGKTTWMLTNPLNSPRARFADSAGEMAEDVQKVLESGVLPGQQGRP
jgi:hypothetical protein